MISFLIKKSFFDAWDHLFGIILMNIGFILCLGLMIFLPSLVEGSSTLLMAICLIPGFFIGHIFAGIASVLLLEVSDYKSISWNQLKNGLFKTWKVSIFVGFINSLFLLAVIIGIPFYLSMGSFVGLAGASVIFWVAIFWLSLVQYFFPILIRMDGGIKVSLKKSALVALDNPGFSLFTLLFSIILFLLSAVLVFLLPGVGAVLLFQQDAFKLRLYKYDWLEEHPELKGEKIPWTELLEEDKENIGPRSLRGMIFPWKD
ncbi:MAG: hypothetical protein PQJ46_08235 [Spirochaetales bacterium]|nr:hypothetical protein [Spirochaetales bacterium]